MAAPQIGLVVMVFGGLLVLGGGFLGVFYGSYIGKPAVADIAVNTTEITGAGAGDSLADASGARAAPVRCTVNGDCPPLKGTDAAFGACVALRRPLSKIIGRHIWCGDADADVIDELRGYCATHVYAKATRDPAAAGEYPFSTTGGGSAPQSPRRWATETGAEEPTPETGIGEEHPPETGVGGRSPPVYAYCLELRTPQKMVPMPVVPELALQELACAPFREAYDLYVASAPVPAWVDRAAFVAYSAPADNVTAEDYFALGGLMRTCELDGAVDVCVQDASARVATCSGVGAKRKVGAG